MIKLKTFELEKIDLTKHYNLINNLSKDTNICNYISKNFYNFVKKRIPLQDNIIEPGKAYVITKDNIDIGIIGSSELSSDGILEVWCAIRKDLQNKSYGSKLLWEITIYLIENIKGLEDIELKINNQNFNSIHVATSNGYVYRTTNTTNEISTYRYFNEESTKRKR